MVGGNTPTVKLSKPWSGLPSEAAGSPVAEALRSRGVHCRAQGSRGLCGAGRHAGVFPAA